MAMTKEQRREFKKQILVRDLVASILDPRHHFDMIAFTTMPIENELKKVATHVTASCMAGHLEAIRKTSDKSHTE